MRHIPQLLYFLLYLLFFVCNVSTFNSDISLKKDIGDANYIISEWKCNSDDECTATDSVCKNDLCQCAPEYVFNTNMTSCVKVATAFYDPCEETIQCSAYLLSGAKCIENVCVCGPGYYYLHGKCNRYVDLDEECKHDIDCYVNADFEASSCDIVKKICTCSPGFYLREYRTCRRKGTDINDECTIDIDCKFNNGVCNDEFVCATKSRYDKIAEFSSDNTMIINSLNEKITMDINCTIDDDCSALGNAVCGPAGTCRCDRGYFASDTDTVCIPELGETCRNGDISHMQNSFCRGGWIWSCTNGTVASKNNRECLKAATKYEGDCRQDEQCYVFGPDAMCIENKCVCNETVSHYVESELFCWGSSGVDETCKKDRDCYVKDFIGELICNGTCVCPDGMHLNKNKTACIDTSAGLGEVCEVDEDCATSDSVCEEEVCSCIENYYPSREECLAGINATCAVYDDCMPRFSECTNDTCSCNPDYVAVAIDSCLPILLYGDLCSMDIQCSINVMNAICAPIEVREKDSSRVTKSSSLSEIKICSCSKEDYYKSGQCFKKNFLGEDCVNSNECYDSFDQGSIICKNGKCACDWGYRKLNNSVCENGSVTNVMSAGLFLTILFVFSFKAILDL